ncbi:uncharacterized protein LOC114529226 [Dendronephthya gigantea]|uniref:uncharacterized protein LOC114529226 n=1 Tax=Dendronephthya gigantea TaxID=151771 RepID=UPI00106D7ADF|nr:uncharacterized protein LOC114529226 [Dendronephthya gigantea]
MPPKKNKNTSKPENPDGEISAEVTESTNEKATLKALLDSRLNKQSDHLNNLFLKFLKSTKSDLDEIKQSQDFLSSKFDSLATSVNELRAENNDLRTCNAQLTDQMKSLQQKADASEDELENLKQYIRRDMLEIHGIPVTEGENTNNIILNIAKLADHTSTLKQDISISHHLPSRQGQIPAIIVKFGQRDTRDKVYKMRRNLFTKTSADLGFPEESRIYINESLTQKGRDLLWAVKEYKRENRYKYVWIFGKVFLKKDATPSSQVFSFTSKKNFDQLKAGLSSHR